MHGGPQMKSGESHKNTHILQSTWHSLKNRFILPAVKDQLPTTLRDCSIIHKRRFHGNSLKMATDLQHTLH